MDKNDEIDRKRYINDIKECTLKLRNTLSVLKMSILMNVISSFFVLVIIIFFPLVDSYRHHIVYYFVLTCMLLLQVYLSKYLKNKAMEFKIISKSVFSKWTRLMDNAEWGESRRKAIHKGLSIDEFKAINEYYEVISSKFSPTNYRSYIYLSRRFSSAIILLIIVLALVRLFFSVL